MLSPTLEKHRSKILVLLAFAGAYLTVFFPFAFFRNDDWWILGNSIRLPGNWAFAFTPTLFVKGLEFTWFFRPFFKIGTFLFFQAFGYNYYLWLVSTLLFTMGAVWYASKAIEVVTGAAQNAFLFTLMFVCAVHLHFGSVMWMGEGLMNCPQVFLLFANLYFFCLSLLKNSHRTLHSVMALVLYVLSIGFKESAVFHPVFLAALLFSEPVFRKMAFFKRALHLSPYVVVTGVFVVYRLFYLPVNHGYIPSFSNEEIKDTMILLASLALPVFIFVVAGLTEKGLLPPFLKTFFKKWLHFLFLLLVISPYIGHPFFSPGWLLSPGIYMILCLSLSLPQPQLSRRFYKILGISLLIVSSIPVFWRLHKTGWWHWYRPQRQVLEIFQSERTKNISAVVFYECDGGEYPGVDLHRVVGTPYGLFELWHLNHTKKATVIFDTCDAIPPHIPPDDTTLHIKWTFPSLTVLN